jgi:hypothetical protein
VTDTALDRNIAVFFRDGFQLDDPSRELVSLVGAIGNEMSNREGEQAAREEGALPDRDTELRKREKEAV